MYLHRPTGEYRLLLQTGRFKVKDQIGCYVLSLGSDQHPRFIGWPETSSRIFGATVQVRDSLHWYPVYCPAEKNMPLYERKLVVVFDTIAESFRRMREPTIPGTSCIFDMDGTLGICTCSSSSRVVDIWVLQSYENEVWDLKYRIELPVAEITREFEDCGEYWEWDFDVVSVNAGVLLLVRTDGWLLHIDSDGKLVNSFYRRHRGLCMSECRFKQSLVQHAFFPALEGYVVNASPFI
uniref:Uncharacterized protein n=1 Tax=Avena sativa TaxID=4498 RepID=A0ACD5XHI0_AVESA